MSYLSNTLVAASAVVWLFGAASAFAETQEAAYDPVANAIALGLTPEDVDAVFDAALREAEICDSAAQETGVLGCVPQNVAGSALVLVQQPLS